MNKGIIIYAFKKTAYGKFAYNLAVSLKYNSPELPICLLHDGNAIMHLTIDQRKFFDQEIIISYEDMYDKGMFSPGKAKLSGYKYFPYEWNMIIDADTVCIKPLGELFEKCSNKPIYSQTVGTWTEEAESWTCQWMSLSNCKAIFDLPIKYRLFEINSSFMIVHKCEEADKFYQQALVNYYKGDRNPKVSKIWGGTFPDELAFNIAFAQCGIEPNFDDLSYDQINNINPKPIYFSTLEAYKPNKYGDDFYFLGCYGGRNFTSKSLQDQCDRYMRGYANHFGLVHQWKYHLLMRSKHIEGK